jgi:hypothetical protein
MDPRTGKTTMTPEYNAWRHAIQRCEDPTHRQFHRYGGRGIVMSPEWRHDFAAFFTYIGPRPTAAHSLDRFPNPDGNYEPGNVRWATKDQQVNNTCRNHWLEANGQRLTLTQWAAQVGIDSRTIHWRLKHGWPVERALTAPR